MIKKLSPNEIEDIKEALRTKRYFDRNNLPGNVGGWGKYVLREPIPMVFLRGLFAVHRPDGDQIGKDGWLCLDQDGYPYVLDEQTHKGNFELVETGEEKN